MLDILTILKAVSDETRLRILALLLRGEMTVGEIVTVIEQSQPRVSRHLKIMCDAGLLDRFQEGTWVFYRVSQQGFAAQIVKTIAAGLSENDMSMDKDYSRLQDVREKRSCEAERYFKANAQQWETIRSLFVADDEVEKGLGALLPQVDDKRYSRILDIGTGTGRMLELFSAKFNEALGLDISADMLRVARSRLSTTDLAHCQFRRADMYSLPLNDGEWDVVIIHQVLHFADDPVAVLGEAYRVLRQGGTVLIADFAPHSNETLREEYAHRRLGFSDEEMTLNAGTVGFEKKSSVRLKGGELEVILWRFDRPGTYQMNKIKSKESVL